MSILTLKSSNSLVNSAFRRASGGNPSLFHNILLILGGSVLIALSAQAAIPLPFTPVPVTGQTFAILVVGMALGSWRGGLAVVAYLMEGALGLPVFAGGKGGLVVLFGPTSGYLFGFVAAAFIVGLLAERRWDRHPVNAALAMLVGNIVIYIPGLVVLGLVLGVNATTAIEYGFLPFYLGDLVKLVLAAAVLPLAWHFLGKTR
jgi:biotin transport system substrate-specific component